MKKSFSIMMVLLLFILVAVPSVGLAKEEKVYSEKKIDKILIKAGTPEDALDDIDYETKQIIIRNSGKDLKYVSSSKKEFYRDPDTNELVAVPEQNGDFTTMDAIPRSKLIFRITVFSNSQGSAYKDVYGNFEWLESGSGPAYPPAGIKEDMFAITVPDGWEIQSGSYGGNLWDMFCGPNYGCGDWRDQGTSGIVNDGDPASDGYSMYGAAWKFDGTTVESNTNRYKATTWLTMEKKDPNALDRIIVEYMEAVYDFYGNFTVGLTWKALNVTFTPDKGEVNLANFDHDF